MTTSAARARRPAWGRRTERGGSASRSGERSLSPSRCSRAHNAASTRLVAPIRRNALARWALTVISTMSSARHGLVRPPAREHQHVALAIARIWSRLETHAAQHRPGALCAREHDEAERRQGHRDQGAGSDIGGRSRRLRRHRARARAGGAQGGRGGALDQLEHRLRCGRARQLAPPARPAPGRARNRGPSRRRAARRSGARDGGAAMKRPSAVSSYWQQRWDRPRARKGRAPFVSHARRVPLLRHESERLQGSDDALGPERKRV